MENFDSLECKSRVQEVAVLVNDVTANLGLPVQDVVEEEVDTRKPARKDATKHLSSKVKADILMSDLFHPELCSCNAVKNAMEALSSVPMHILTPQTSSHKLKGMPFFKKQGNQSSHSFQGFPRFPGQRL